MSRRQGKAREMILQSAAELVRMNGAAAVTVESVAKSAGTAKGLVHYHFKTKQGLLSAVAHQITKARIDSWSTVLQPGVAASAPERSWQLLAQESATGVMLAWQTLLCPGTALPASACKCHASDFSSSLGAALARLLEHDMGLVPTVPAAEIGWLMASVVDGVGLQLLAGADPEQLHGAYAAGWLGLLALTSPT